eukprot:CAMPEP_0181125134 /NCGR_PEP_ID=MMETSP1071-20121207/26872_1 /TAXON_ID=35127 /ORGANISM="Thalassiosira sp., Strain NH16" /LENGTH=425 /DNA_ID=CAMNT_0023210525 /DNA_START=270 /DNA_END=1544 /DNA_ORIENTATION=+
MARPHATNQQQRGRSQPVPVHQGIVGRSHDYHGTPFQLNTERNAMNTMSSLSRSNLRVGYPQFYPQPNPAPLPSLPQGFANPSRPTAQELSQLYSYPPQKNLSDIQQHSFPQTAANPAQPAPSNKPPQLYSIHRFIISEGGVIGVNITMQTKTQFCRISTVKPNSVALRHGVQTNDDILPPYATSGEGVPNIYDLFLEASRHRPIRFECKRPYEPSLESACPLPTPHSLHRFIITEPGRLGIILCRNDQMMACVSSIGSNSLSEIHGLRKNDIICKSHTNGSQQEDFNTFVKLAQSGTRPLTIEVWREVPTSMPERPRLSRHGLSSASKNPFVFSFPTQSQKIVKETNNSSPTEKSSKGEEIILIDDDDDDDDDDGANNIPDDNRWKCDFCQMPFLTYDEALEHEKICVFDQRGDSVGEEKKKDC